jgi:hypothetical protein
MPTTPFFRTTLGILLILVITLIVVSWFDKDDLDLQMEQYCHNVQNKVWPDFKGVYREMCPVASPASSP